MSSVVLRAEYRGDSPFVATARPRLSWVVQTNESGWEQHRVQLQLDSSQTIELFTSENTFVAWPFADLEEDEIHHVRVRIEAASGGWSAWSSNLKLRLATRGTWTAPFIGLPDPQRAAQPVMLSHDFDVQDGLIDAVIHHSALGAATVLIDDQAADDAVLSPGWTSYESRVLYDSFEVTDRLSAGTHRLAIELTGAWYTEEYGFGPQGTRVYGEQPVAALELRLRYADGSMQSIVTGSHWLADGENEIVDSGIYKGEFLDTRRRRTGSGVPASVTEVDAAPVPRTHEPVRRVRELSVRTHWQAPNGGYIVDFGQNLVGRIRLQVSGPEGSEITVRHAEVIENNELATRPLRRATATDRFILSGAPDQVVEPRGTFHGFRYAHIDGWPTDFDPRHVTAVVLHSDMKQTAEFSSSHLGLNRLHENVVWSMRGNFLSVPTDCPQRDERLGWTGDVQSFVPTASTLFDCAGFLGSWLEDLEFEQEQRHGIVPFVVPDALKFPVGPMAAWADAATIVPDTLTHRFGDEQVSVRQLSSMRSMVDAVQPFVDDSGIWQKHNQFGDWLDPDAPADAPGAAKTSSDIVATAYLYRSTLIVARWLRQQQSTLAMQYEQRAEHTRRGFHDHFVTPAGRMASDAPTAYALALHFGLVTDSTIREKLGQRLADLTRRNGYRIATGFVGTPIILDALTDAGHPDVAMQLLLQSDFPSWLYPVSMGATTIWERWDSLLPDGSINPGEMTSFNHYAFGAVVDWLYRRLAGIEPVAAGYRKIRYAPVIARQIDEVNASLESPSGRIETSWSRKGDQVHCHLVVPAHATAEVSLPDGQEYTVGTGTYHWLIDEAPVEFQKLHFGSTFRQLADDTEAREALWAPIEQFNSELAATLRKRIDWTLEDPLPVGLFDVPPPVQSEIAQGLERLNQLRFNPNQ
ncbi:family 78 glycoside hydrolase catalytic domain [Glutamicibacter sp. NPDC087344]|uniref:alpha-L-rhamnosidase n=1 Tax=Glutamicibacter sp. NPDC087344 TaxID=3363994 RepID=UPI0037F12C02